MNSSIISQRVITRISDLSQNISFKVGTKVDCQEALNIFKIKINQHSSKVRTLVYWKKPSSGRNKFNSARNCDPSDNMGAIRIIKGSSKNNPYQFLPH